MAFDSDAPCACCSHSSRHDWWTCRMLPAQAHGDIIGPVSSWQIRQSKGSSSSTASVVVEAVCIILPAD
eukprot:115841-Prymnesium_polylepis.2